MGWTVLAQPVNFRIRVPELHIFSKRKTEKDRNSEVYIFSIYPTLIYAGFLQQKMMEELIFATTSSFNLFQVFGNTTFLPYSKIK